MHRLRRTGDDAHVLDEDVEPATDLGAAVVVGLEHARAAVAEHERLGRTGAQGLERRRGVEPEGPGQGERLGTGGDVHAAQQLVDGLHGLAVAGAWAHPLEGPREDLEHGRDQRERLVGGADGDQQRAVARADRSAGDGRVDEVQADGVEADGDLADRLDADGRGQQDDRAGLEHVRDAVIAEQGAVELGVVAHGEQDDVDPARGIPSRVRGLDPRRDGEGGALRGRVGGADQGVRREAGRHRQAHRAQAEDCDHGGDEGAGE